jgi:hypothetical protein
MKSFEPRIGQDVFYVEKIGSELFDRTAEVLGVAVRCLVCHEPPRGHERRGRRHPYQEEVGLSLRVTFPAGRKRGLPEEITDYPFVAPGTDANQWHT